MDWMTGKLVISSRSKTEGQAILGIRVHQFAVANYTHKWKYVVEAIEVTFKGEEWINKVRESRKLKTEKQSMTMVNKLEENIKEKKKEKHTVRKLNLE